MALPLVAAGIGASVLGGTLGAWIRGKSEEEAAAILQKARDEFGRISLPRLQELAAQDMGPSAMEGVTGDADYEAAMRGALARMRGAEGAGGMTLSDRASMNEGLDAAALQERSQRAAIRNDFQARGAGGSGQEMLASLVNQQGAAQRANRAGMDAAAGAQQRYWQNVRDRFSMGSQASQADLAQKNKVAAARDAQARWNAQRKTDAAQGDFDNAMRRVAGKAGMDQAAAAGIAQRGAQTGAMVAGIGDAAGRLLNEAGAEEDPRKKTYGY